MKLTFRPLTPDLWPALEDLFGKNGAVNGCWCMYWRIGSAYHKRPREENRAATMQDPAFLADMEQAGLEVTANSGEAALRIVNESLDLPPDLAGRLADILK